jgi:hypothetical protein
VLFRPGVAGRTLGPYAKDGAMRGSALKHMAPELQKMTVAATTEMSDDMLKTFTGPKGTMIVV